MCRVAKQDCCPCKRKRLILYAEGGLKNSHREGVPADIYSPHPELTEAQNDPTTGNSPGCSRSTCKRFWDENGRGRP